MRKLFALLLILTVLPLSAVAEADLSAMSMDDLVQLRDAVNLEIASRNAAEPQTVTVDGVAFRLMLAEVGQARDDLPGLGIILLANNTGTASMTPLYDLGVTVTQGGKPLETSWVESEHFTSRSVITSDTAVIAPGAVDMQVYLGFILDGEGDRVEITLSREHTRVSEDPYCGTFVVDLSTLR